MYTYAWSSSTSYAVSKIHSIVDECDPLSGRIVIIVSQAIVDDVFVFSLEQSHNGIVGTNYSSMLIF